MCGGVGNDFENECWGLTQVSQIFHFPAYHQIVGLDRSFFVDFPINREQGMAFRTVFQSAFQLAGNVLAYGLMPDAG